MKIYTYLREHSLLPPSEMLILDLGCGDGRVLTPFYHEGYRVMGVDIDERRIAAAQDLLPEGSFKVDDIRNMQIHQPAFVIARNVLPFFDRKEEVDSFLQRHKNHQMYFTLFGGNDEKAGIALTWTKEEVDSISRSLGARLIEEFDGMSTNLVGDPRRSHIFHIIRT